MPLPLYPWQRSPGTHYIGGWVDPRAGLDDMEKWKFFYPTGTRSPAPPGRPAHSQSLYRLTYPGSLHHVYVEVINDSLYNSHINFISTRYSQFHIMFCLHDHHQVEIISNLKPAPPIMHQTWMPQPAVLEFQNTKPYHIYIWQELEIPANLFCRPVSKYFGSTCNSSVAYKICASPQKDKNVLK
jgi:hypothetical protein